jgi:hypothetical protein
MEVVSRRDELRAEIEVLPRQKGEAIDEAVSEARPVSDKSLTSLSGDPGREVSGRPGGRGRERVVVRGRGLWDARPGQTDQGRGFVRTAATAR